MRKENLPASGSATSWTSREAYLLALICLACGLALGYVARGPSAATAPATPTSPAYASQPGEGFTPPSASPELKAAPLLAALKADPQNAGLLVQLGNVYSDNRDYSHAIEYYQRALDRRPTDVNVRTDMGTCYWYAGQPERAVAEYRRSLSVNPTHSQTLFNLGVVLSDGLKDFNGAIVVWEKLLQSHPDCAEKPRVLRLIEETKAKKSQRLPPPPK